MASKKGSTWHGMTTEQRFWSKVDTSGGPDACHPWIGELTEDGYGRVYISPERKAVLAHRYAYEQKHGPIPAGRELDHLCRMRRCCNDSHLEPVTHAENVARGHVPTHRRGVCRNGHTIDSTTLDDYPGGHPQCSICRRESVRRRYEARTHARAA